jgi:uncharacterized damage-inducible protein DinB
MELILENIAMMHKMKEYILELPDDYYTSPNSLLSQASVGQHFRHIIEFYLCLELGASKEMVCYDERKRDLLIENHKGYAIQVIEGVIQFLNEIPTDKPMLLKACYSSTSDAQTNINTSLQRELAYALDHTIHHLALVKIALINMGVPVDSEFGVAPSTLKHRKVCAQ